MYEIDPIPATLGVDAFVYRTRGEISYVQALTNIPLRNIEGWRDTIGVRQAALCFQKPLLRVEFRYLTKRSRYWLSWIADERRFRSTLNVAVPYQCPQVVLMNRDARRRSFNRFPLG